MQYGYQDGISNDRIVFIGPEYGGIDTIISKLYCLEADWMIQLAPFLNTRWPPNVFQFPVAPGLKIFVLCYSSHVPSFVLLRENAQSTSI